MQPIAYDAARARLFTTVALAYAAIGLALPFSKVSIDYASFAAVYVGAAITVLISVYAASRDVGRLKVVLDVVVAGSLVAVPITVSTYLAIGVGMPLADRSLAALDAALGFDWRGFIAFVDARPALAVTLDYAYNSFLFQIFFIPLGFACAGKGVRACAIVFSYVFLCFLSSLVSIWFPCVGAYVTYGVGPGDVANLNAKYGYHFLEQFHAVRDQVAFVLTAGNTAGILTFPSVHAGVAALCAWAAWDSRTFRYPVFGFNVAMAAAAVSHGGHYLIDVFAGFCVAAVSIAVARALFFRPSPQPSANYAPAGGVAV